MGKFASRSKDQKRKAKLKLRAQRAEKPQALAYAGNKYKNEKYLPVITNTETGILQAYGLCGRTLTDEEVGNAIEQLILQMREGPLPPHDPTVVGGTREELVIWSIRTNWRALAEERSLPGREVLIGVLRTILHSVDVWHAKTMHPQGYLRFLEPFLKKVGIICRVEASSTNERVSDARLGQMFLSNEEALANAIAEGEPAEQ